MTKAMKKPTLRQQLADAQQVCADTYQIVGSLLHDLDKFNTEAAGHLLDNLMYASPIHKDLLPWPSYSKPGEYVQISVREGS